VKISKDQIRNISASPRWKLYFESFPNCVTDDNKWPSNEGVIISFSIIKKATQSSEGEISISFLDNINGKIRGFLHNWKEGTWETNTGRQQSLQDLSANVIIIDENAIEKDLTLCLTFPNHCNISDEAPNIRTGYYDRKK
jgi:hypothetical protein